LNKFYQAILNIILFEIKKLVWNTTEERRSVPKLEGSDMHLWDRFQGAIDRSKHASQHINSVSGV